MSMLSGLATGIVGTAVAVGSAQPAQGRATTVQSGGGGGSAASASVIPAISELGRALSSAEDAVMSVGGAVVDVLSSPVASALVYTAAGKLLR